MKLSASATELLNIEQVSDIPWIVDDILETQNECVLKMKEDLENCEKKKFNFKMITFEPRVIPD